MRLVQVSWQRLPAGSEERQMAQLAAIASNDTWIGGASALVLAGKMPCTNRDPDTGRFRRSPWTLDARTAKDVVSDVYSSSNGTSRRFMAYECPECGSASLGEDSAYRCCQEQERDYA